MTNQKLEELKKDRANKLVAMIDTYGNGLIETTIKFFKSEITEDQRKTEYANGALDLFNKIQGLLDAEKRKVCKECQCESDPGLESHMAGCSQNMNSICSEHKMKMYGCAKCYPYLITN